MAALRDDADAAVPRTWPAARCDIVMKGGITSGVVYPRAVHELARRYRLASVGGTSAGAIAAAAAAAAEYGRARGGYDRLDALPDWIGGGDNLARLFQPQRRTRALFRVLMAGVGPGRRWLRVPLALLRGYWLAALLGALPGAALAALSIAAGGALAVRIAGGAGGVLLALAGIALLVAAAAARTSHAIVGNDFGLCSGMPGEGAGGRPALTPWLTDLIDGLAGRPAGADDPPLTFGDLWDGPPEAPDRGGAREDDRGDPDERGPWLRLEMMTTNVTNRRAERLPSASRELYFDPAELRRLFPERVVAHMCARVPPIEGDGRAVCERRVRRRLMEPLLPLPLPADLPVVVATRMSLSFPVLLSAVPLWRVDWSAEENREADAHWAEWVRAHDSEFAALFDDPVRWPAIAASGPRVRAERCWFSDGGVASNFPIQFFDAPMPRHPTFGINLRPFPPGVEPSADERENVWMVRRVSEGISDAWYRFDGDGGTLWDGRLGAFLGGLVRTMQNRVDDAQLRVPGYRERVVHVQLSAAEGGMNLAMPAPTIAKLTERGRCAAERLVQAYAQPPADPLAVSWDAHRWVRMRSALPALAELVRAFADGWSQPAAPNQQTYRGLVERADDAPPGSYRLRGDAQRRLALRVSEDLAALAALLDADEVDLADRAPRPAPAFQLAPQDLVADGRPAGGGSMQPGEES
ncbi:MAG TPA: hypothetical protein VFU94_04000 [Conexibacter sp.]|nr:hypothetical protein [Conexibacter sp.]